MQNTASSSGVKKGLFIIPYAQLSNYQTGVNLNGSKDYVKMYLKNCCVAALSAVFNAGASTDVALVTNFDIPAEYRDLLYANHVIHMKIPFDLFDFGAEYKWSLAFYKLCVLHHICRETNYDYYAYADSDTYIQSDFSYIWRECDKRILLYDITHGLQGQHYQHFLEEVTKYSSDLDLITHYGGEFFAASKENAGEFSCRCLDVYHNMRQNQIVTTHGDEFIISIVASQLQNKVKNAGAYIYRFWTGCFRLMSTN